MLRSGSPWRTKNFYLSDVEAKKELFFRFNLIPESRKVHVHRAGASIGAPDDPLVRVFGHQLTGDGIDSVVGGRYRDAGAHGTGAGRLNRFRSEGRCIALSGHLYCIATAERLRSAVAYGCNAIHPLHHARPHGQEPGHRGCALDEPEWMENRKIRNRCLMTKQERAPVGKLPIELIEMLR